MSIEVKNSAKEVDYVKSIEFLEQRVEDVYMGKKNELLWIIEHNPVYTAGSSSKNTDLLNKNVKVIKTNRGGKHTFHGPGQKVVYFVLNLNKRGKNIRSFVNKIEKCIIEILKVYKIESYPDKKNIGIWVKNKKETKKIASIGIKVRKWIAYHGFSLNVSNDLSKYNAIVPCGIIDKKVTSMQEIGVNNYNNIEKIIINKFLNIFY